jgi:hypothetical protein
MSSRLLVVCLLPALLAAPPAVLAQESFADLAKEWKEMIGQDGFVTDRVALVGRVEDFDDRDAAKLLLDGAGSLSARIDALFKDLAKVETALKEVDIEDDIRKDGMKSRDELREKLSEVEKQVSGHRTVMERIRKAVLKLESANARAVVVTAATAGGDWRPRGIAAQAAATYPTPEGRAAALRALKDKEPRVAIQTLFGLKDRKDPETVGPVAECLLKGANWVMQSAAAEALGAIAVPACVRPLVEALSKADGRLRDDIRQALVNCTGQQFPADYEDWKKWYEEHRAEFEAEGAKPLAKQPAGKADPADDPGTYYGIPTLSKRIVYVLDVSGSMELEIGGKGVATPKEGEEEQARGPKVEIAKNELKNAIRKLPDDACFNIVVFNHKVRTWQEKMVQAKQDTKNDAYKFIRDLKASGSTWTYGALKEAFRFAGIGAADPNYASGVDTIFLLSDGAPTDQSMPTSKLMDPEIVLGAVREWNALSKIVIHAIAIDPQTQGATFIKFMKLLAEQNGGKYTERG